jgi:hypothetical protein
MRRLIGVALGLALGACAGGQSGGFLQGEAARPEVIVISDIDLASDVTLLDSGFSARLQRKTANIAPHVIREQLSEKVRQEIVYTLIAALRDGGLKAREGSEETVSLSEPAVMVTARVQGVGQAASRGQRSLFTSAAGTKSQVAANVELSHISSSGKKPLTTFIAPPDTSRPPARGTPITPGEGAIAEKLSPEVEAAARRLARGIARKIMDFAKEKEWLAKPAT